MSEPTISQKISIYRSLFKGREDVFALRWEKGEKSGYMPAYYYDPYRYRLHKIKGGSFQNYSEKSYLPLTDEQIVKHLNGFHFIGLYPLLVDNTSWFIAADFDEENWIEESRKFIRYCADKNIPTYLERSRSGKGCHVWLFFEQPYPAIKSRRIFHSLLMGSGIVSQFDKSSSFDRLFPNQDYHSGKGLGNLIALPLYKPAMDKGNTCFVDPENMEPYTDQWKFLSGIQKIKVRELDQLHDSLIVRGLHESANYDTGLTISLSNVLRLNRAGIPLILTNYLRDELNFANAEFIIKNKAGKSTFGTERFFRIIEESKNEIIIPKGFAGKLLRFCKDSSINFTFNDQRQKLPKTIFKFQTELMAFQEPAVIASTKKDMGVIVAPPGAGKTIIALKIIADKQQPALVVVHRKQLMEQWQERIEAFMGISKHEIGKIGSGTAKAGKQITIATIQSLARVAGHNDIENKFGTIIMDECHHIPAKSYRDIIKQFNSYYLYGLTATPFRKYNDGKLIFSYIGEVIAEISKPSFGDGQQIKIIVRNTELNVPFNSKTDKFEILSQILIHDSSRNIMILEDITNELKSGKKVVVLTERKEHIDSLNQYLKQFYEVITLSGDDSESSRTAKWRMLSEGNYQALITTGQFFGEGTDLQNANCLFLVYPFSFEGKLIQYIGRVQRSECAPSIYDYRDINIDYLNKMFLKRNVYYRKLQRQVTLFDDVVEQEAVPSKKATIIDKQIHIAIQLLEFRYGNIGFKYFSEELDLSLEFEILHDNIRPEFEVLKPYFVKVFKSKNIAISVYAEIEDGQLISQYALSEDLKRIDRKVIESVRFQFVTKPLYGKTFLPKEIHAGLNTDHPLYESGQELLDEVLQNTQFKHHKQLFYLAENHEGNLIKVRFILEPFSFIFLLQGEHQFHLIMETLDTEEATYLWHFPKRASDLHSILNEVDRHLTNIKKNGRQKFLMSPPENFSRVLHDYSDKQKGFVIWKDMLLEQIT